MLTRFVLERRSEAYERGCCIPVRTRLYLFLFFPDSDALMTMASLFYLCLSYELI